MRIGRAVVLAFIAVGVSGSLSAQPSGLSPAIYADPPRNAEHPAAMTVLHIPSGDVEINGIAYTAAGAGPHPAMLLLHGYPGNEKNLDLAQAVRRAGWTVVTINYRGSWGSPGNFSFAGNLDDAAAALAYLRDPANAETLGIDPARIVLAGHSMGGWVTAMTAERDHDLAGAILISAPNMGAVGRIPRDRLIGLTSTSMESLAGVSAESMADELAGHADALDWTPAAAALAGPPMLILSAEDGLAPMTDALSGAVRGAGGAEVTDVHVDTDHSWSDSRIRLESEVIGWLAGLSRGE